MKKLVIVLLFLAVLPLGMPLFAQQISPENTSDFYYVNVQLEKVYPTKFGYILQYHKSENQMGRIYVPNDWFTYAGSKAEQVNLPPGKNWPSLSVYYQKGEFSHLKLYVHPSRAHQTWGNVPLPINSTLGHFFENVDTIKIEY